MQAERVRVAEGGGKVMLSHLEVPVHGAPPLPGDFKIRAAAAEGAGQAASWEDGGPGLGSEPRPAATSLRVGSMGNRGLDGRGPGPCPGWHCPCPPRQGSDPLQVLVLQRPFLPASLLGLVPAQWPSWDMGYGQYGGCPALGGAGVCLGACGDWAPCGADGRAGPGTGHGTLERTSDPQGPPTGWGGGTHSPCWSM